MSRFEHFPIQVEEDGLVAGPHGMARSYHERTFHHFHRYAKGPGSLDWDAQPRPFRSYRASEGVALPHLAALEGELAALLERPLGEAAAQPAGATLDSLGVLLRLALSITAFKSLGPDRWAVRANPSSGNLHPVEAYVALSGWDGFAPGVYHYLPERHALELRSAWAPERDCQETQALLCLSTVPWRETWKYGERAFRYCQLDVGHATACVALAAHALGWQLVERRDISSSALAEALGLDRAMDYPKTRSPSAEREQPEVALEIVFPGSRPGAMDLGARSQSATFLGQATLIDPRPLYSWPIVEQVYGATQWAPASPLLPPERIAGPAPCVEPRPSQRSLREIVLGRRSAQRFDRKTELPLTAFERIMTAALGAHSWFGSETDGLPPIDFVAWVHRVDGLVPGVYLIGGGKEPVREASLVPPVREASPAFLAAVADTPGTDIGSLEEALRVHFSLTKLDVFSGDGAPHLFRIAEIEPRPLAAQARMLHCHQDIAATSCVTLGMITDLDRIARGPEYDYRRVLRKAGRLGHGLYLASECEGLNGTAIGCFFDSGVRDVLKLAETQYYPVYHFCIGRALSDPRIETSLPYLAESKSKSESEDGSKSGQEGARDAPTQGIP